MLDGNNLQAVPDCSCLTKLTTLGLSNNQLRSFPDGYLPRSLTSLDVHSNTLSSLPNDIGNLNHLQVFSCSTNVILSLPPSFANLGSLGQLFMSHNLVTEVDVLGHLSNLAIVGCNYNRITRLPPHMARMKSLNIIQASNNQIATLPLSMMHINFGRVNLLHNLAASKMRDDNNNNNNPINQNVDSNSPVPALVEWEIDSKQHKPPSLLHLTAMECVRLCLPARFTNSQILEVLSETTPTSCHPLLSESMIPEHVLESLTSAVQLCDGCGELFLDGDFVKAQANVFCESSQIELKFSGVLCIEKCLGRTARFEELLARVAFAHGHTNIRVHQEE
eukprot:c12760_g2_i1.p1 GENE.c12760_g2_i1~~c12760_g2_i1.p1  ORF type:complete len:334 (-),score=75.96 c12760_g2_i1:167-1168(-)